MMIKKIMICSLSVCLLVSVGPANGMGNTQNDQSSSEKKIPYKLLTFTLGSWAIGQTISGIVNHYFYKKDPKKDGEKETLLNNEEKKYIDTSALNDYMKTTFNSVKSDMDDEFKVDFDKLGYAKKNDLNGYLKLEDMKEFVKNEELNDRLNNFEHNDKLLLKNDLINQESELYQTIKKIMAQENVKENQDHTDLSACVKQTDLINALKTIENRLQTVETQLNNKQDKKIVKTLSQYGLDDIKNEDHF